jgi:glucose-6-phosphate isomerase, archaeal
MADKDWDGPDTQVPRLARRIRRRASGTQAARFENYLSRVRQLRMKPEVAIDFSTGELAGSPLHDSSRTIGDMKGYYRDERARQSLDPETVVYRVQAFLPGSEGEEGDLLLGTTFVQPGTVGDEYFMTKGHFHLNRKRTEYYITVAGSGGLILMDESRRTRFEPMRPGSVHYIPSHTAHRVANLGDSVLAFLACWPSDAGHDYESIASKGFGARLRKVNGIATLVEES